MVDNTLFTKKKDSNIIIVQIYVDDIIFGSTCQEMCDDFAKIMHDEFEMSMMGELNFFSGLQIKQLDDGIFFNQSKYIKEMLNKFGQEDSKPIKTLISTETKLTRDEEGESVDNTKYRGMIGSLLYLTASRPDIMFSVCLCARFQEDPKTSHLKAVKRIFRYIKGTMHLGLWYLKGSGIETIVYADSDHKQTALAISTTEAEYVSAGKACQQALWMKQALVDYGIRLDDIPLMCDNKKAIDLSKNPVQHSRIKHIEIRHHFLRDNVQKGNISIENVSSEDNIADILTKPLKREPFNYLRLGISILKWYQKLVRRLDLEELFNSSKIFSKLIKMSELNLSLPPRPLLHSESFIIKKGEYDYGHEDATVYEHELKGVSTSQNIAFLSTEVKGSTLKQSTAELHITKGKILMLSRAKEKAEQNGRNDKRFVAIEDSTQKLGGTDNIDDIDWTKGIWTRTSCCFKEFKVVMRLLEMTLKGGRISGKGTIKTSCLDFEKVSYVEELKFNLLSVSQICDKKHNVLFTDKECLILSPKFKFVDEDLVILRAPRKNDVYSLDLKNIIPSGGITCLVAKATEDEAVLWHRRLGHVNFKNINKLVKGNLVRGLPSKTFKLDHSCLACRKGKQHRASCKKIEERTVREPLELLHMDLFGPVSVESINKKKYCLVVTDDCSKFSWVFFLAYKDETYDMLHDLIGGFGKTG
ncbi:retrovirus-related pol polyprotein from transposon TNT 1-94 [Tanacetum coccineum]